jgi:peptide-methionine (S)-S-oxide reductase
MIMEEVSKAVFAGGCFWCTEAVFKRVAGVTEVTSGYTGGDVKNPTYREVCSGTTGHAEAVSILYNNAIISYEALLEIFFATHNPTTINQQGNDIGTQYRSEVFYVDEEQKTLALNYIKMLEEQKIFNSNIVTRVSPLTVFYEAEKAHKDYYNLHTEQPYCQVIIRPKLKKLEKQYSHQLKT